jgi:thioredoxin reductase (NADPH)
MNASRGTDASRARVIVVGAGPAGAAAAIQCRRLGVPVLLVDRAGRAGGLALNARRIENYPGSLRSLGGPEFAKSLRAHLRRFDISVVKADITGITKGPRGFVASHDGGRLAAEAIILANGTEPLRMEIAGEREIEGTRLFYEVRPLLRRRPRPRVVVVVGGGEAACDYALTLAESGAETHLVVRSDRLKARGRLAGAVQRAPRVLIHYNACCERIPTSSRFSVRVRGAGEKNGTDLRPDAVLVAVGRRSAAPRMLDGLGIMAAKDDAAMGVASTNGVACSLPGLFIAGDARLGALGQIGMAVGDGLAAAAAAAAYLEKR